jgi:CBS domain-containing protein
VSHSSSAARLSIPTIAGLVPITDLVSRDPICVHGDAPLSVVIDLVLRRYIGCVPVIDDAGVPIGMITKRDLVEHFAAGRDAHCDAADAMMPLAFTLGARATVARAAALMAAEDVHHIPVVSIAGRLIGVVSTLDIVRWLARNDGMLAA